MGGGGAPRRIGLGANSVPDRVTLGKFFLIFGPRFPHWCNRAYSMILSEEQ